MCGRGGRETGGAIIAGRGCFDELSGGDIPEGAVYCVRASVVGRWCVVDDRSFLQWKPAGLFPPRGGIDGEQTTIVSAAATRVRHRLLSPVDGFGAGADPAVFKLRLFTVGGLLRCFSW